LRTIAIAIVTVGRSVAFGFASKSRELMWAVMAFGCNKMRPGEGCFPLEIFAVAYVPDASRRLVSFHYARTVFFLRSRRRDSLNREVMDFSFFLCYFFFFFLKDVS